MKKTNLEKSLFPDVSGKYGAPMGRRDYVENDKHGKLRVHKVRFVDGDYDVGGAYWGGGGNRLFCIWAKGVEFTTSVCIFVRAANKKDALTIGKIQFDNLSK